MVFDNTVAAINKAPSAIYFLLQPSQGVYDWRKAVTGFPTANDEEVFKPGTGIMIRKYQTGTGDTAFWQNAPDY